MKSIIRESKKNGLVIITVENQDLGNNFKREFVGAKYREKANEYAIWLEKLVVLKSKNSQKPRQLG